MSDERTLLRHLLATLAYRGAKAVRGTPVSFATYKASPTTRTPVEILAHLGDLMDWGFVSARDQPTWNAATPQSWDREVERFFTAITAWDAWLATGAPLARPAEKLIQGAIADALSHVGQINLLRRMSGSPVRGESYARAHIQIGQTGFEQPPPPEGSEFD